METAAAASTARPVRISRKQIFSLLGLIPLGVYVVAHLWTNMYAMAGPLAFNDVLVRSRNSPAFLFLEIFGLGLPILAHTVAGFMELSHARPNNTAYNTFDNLKYILQRVTALGLAGFLGAHIVKARILPAFAEASETIVGGHETWLGMHEALSEPLTFSVYALGLLGVSYHLANGLQTAAMRWGFAVSPAGRSRTQVISMLALVVLLGMSAAALQGFLPFQDVPPDYMQQQAQVIAAGR